MSETKLCASCNKPAFLKCSGCCLVFYCDKNHQREDWSNHRNLCRGFEFIITHEVGPCLTATRDLPKDHTIFSENPFVLGPPHFEDVELPCVGCARRVDPNGRAHCARCRWPVCNTACPGLKSVGHLVECGLLSSVLAHTPLFRLALLALRCLLLQKTNPGKWEWIQEIGPYAEGEIANSVGRVVPMQHLQSLVFPFSFMTNLVPFFSLTTLTQIFAVLDVCSLFWRRPGRVVSGLYANASVLRQSCCSNTRLSFDDFPEMFDVTTKENRPVIGRVTVRALRDIKKGEVLTCSWASSGFTTALRQIDLLSLKNTYCYCPRCLDPTEFGTNLSTLKCTDCSGWMLPVDTANIFLSDWLCQKGCGEILTAVKVNRLLGYLAKIVRAAHDAVKVGYADRSQLMLLRSVLETYLHPDHHLCLLLKKLMLNSIDGKYVPEKVSKLSDEDILTKKEICLDLLKTLKELGPTMCQTEHVIALCLFKLARFDAEMTKRSFESRSMSDEDAVTHLKECKFRLRECLRLLTLPEVLDRHIVGDVARKKIVKEEISILSWAKRKGLNICKH